MAVATREKAVMEWSVRLEAECPSLPTEEQVERLLELLGDHSASVSYGPAGVSAHLWVQADTSASAVSAGLRLFLRACKRAGVAVSSVTGVEAWLWDEFVRRTDDPNVPELVGVAEVARLLKVSRQRVSELSRRSDFPAPLARLATGPIWKKSAVLRFLKVWQRRPGRPPKSAGHGAGLPALPRLNPST